MSSSSVPKKSKQGSLADAASVVVPMDLIVNLNEEGPRDEAVYEIHTQGRLAECAGRYSALPTDMVILSAFGPGYALVEAALNALVKDPNWQKAFLVVGLQSSVHHAVVAVQLIQDEPNEQRFFRVLAHEKTKPEDFVLLQLTKTLAEEVVLRLAQEKEAVVVEANPGKLIVHRADHYSGAIMCVHDDDDDENQDNEQ